MTLCLQPLTSRSKYNGLQQRLCHLPQGHTGAHDEFPFLCHFDETHPLVGKKIVRDSVMTTGAAWKSEEAGPNRILRWVMLLPDDELLKYAIDMSKLKPQVVAKLREKAAAYEPCMAVARKLTWLAYQMGAAPAPPDDIREYLEDFFGPTQPGRTCCLVCRKPLSFALFAQAMRGKAAVETGHSNPRFHDPDNVGFAHRECNIAQGSKTLDEFYEWIAGILERVRN